MSTPRSTNVSNASTGGNQCKPAAISEVLPQDFVPDIKTVLCHRGKVYSTAPGNVRLGNIVKTYIPLYAQAETKTQKSEIVSVIMDRVLKEEGTIFVKLVNGRYHHVDDSAAREKVGGMLRDRLHMRYKSSSKAKSVKRQTMRTVLSSSPTPSATDFDPVQVTSTTSNDQPTTPTDFVPTKLPIDVTVKKNLSQGTRMGFVDLFPTTALLRSCGKYEEEDIKVEPLTTDGHLFGLLEEACDAIDQSMKRPRFAPSSSSQCNFGRCRPQGPRIPRQISIDATLTDGDNDDDSVHMMENLYGSLANNEDLEHITFSPDGFDWTD